MCVCVCFCLCVRVHKCVEVRGGGGEGAEGGKELRDSLVFLMRVFSEHTSDF